MLKNLRTHRLEKSWLWHWLGWSYLWSHLSLLQHHKCMCFDLMGILWMTVLHFMLHSMSLVVLAQTSKIQDTYLPANRQISGRESNICWGLDVMSLPVKLCCDLQGYCYLSLMITVTIIWVWCWFLETPGTFSSGFGERMWKEMWQLWWASHG